MTLDWTIRTLARAQLLLLLGCARWPSNDLGCPRGEQHVDGHCLPTPSIVFQRCMEAFRTRSIEHDRGRELSVSASATDKGGELQHERRDRERREYEGLQDDDLSAAIGECRRQEEAERAGQLARAWDEAETARSDAERARIEAVTAKHELARANAELERREREGERRAAEERFADLPVLEDADPATADELPVLDEATPPTPTTMATPPLADPEHAAVEEAAREEAEALAEVARESL